MPGHRLHVRVHEYESTLDATCEGGGFSGVAISPDGSALFVADCENDKIRRVEVATGAVATLAGSGEYGDADGVGPLSREVDVSDGGLEVDGVGREVLGAEVPARVRS